MNIRRRQQSVNTTTPALPSTDFSGDLTEDLSPCSLSPSTAAAHTCDFLLDLYLLPSSSLSIAHAIAYSCSLFSLSRYAGATIALLVRWRHNSSLTSRSLFFFFDYKKQQQPQLCSSLSRLVVHAGWQGH